MWPLPLWKSFCVIFQTATERGCAVLKTRNDHDGVCDYMRQQHSVGLLRHFYFINYIFKQTNPSCPGFETGAGRFSRSRWGLGVYLRLSEDDNHFSPSDRCLTIVPNGCFISVSATAALLFLALMRSTCVNKPDTNSPAVFVLLSQACKRIMFTGLQSSLYYYL